MSQAESQASLIRLKQTLDALQVAVSRLESADNLSTTALDRWVQDTEQLVQQLQAPVISETVTPTPAIAPDEWDDDLLTEPVPVTNPVKPTRPEGVRPKPRKKQPWWQQQKVIIGTISAAIALIFIWKFTTGTPQLSEEIAQTPSSEPTEQVEPSTPSAPSTPEPTVNETEPEPIAPVVPEPAKPLTPEQRLIAAIQAQLDEVTQPYGDNIVRSIQADFAQNTLRITVGDAWYLLKEGLQDRLGMEVLKLAQVLDFKKMVVEDLQGNFVARNPVIGDRLVIVRRYQEFTPGS